METRASRNSSHVYRPRRILMALMVGAGVLWIGVLLYLLQFDGVPAKTLGTTLFFVLFFAICGFYYGRTAIYVDAAGITYRGMVRTQRVSFADIRKVDVLPGPVTVYAIRGSGGPMHFTSFFRHHQHLVQLLVERAGLAPN